MIRSAACCNRLAPDGTQVRAMIELIVRPASRHRTHAAHRAVERLTTRTLLRDHRRIARWYAEAVGSPSIPCGCSHLLSHGVLHAAVRNVRLGDELDKSLVTAARQRKGSCRLPP